MYVMTFDPDPVVPAPRLRLIHTHRGHILGLRVPGKPYLVLPSAPAESSEQGSDPEDLARAVLTQTGLAVVIEPEYYGPYAPDYPLDRTHIEAVILGGVLRSGAGFFHPEMWRDSPDADLIARFVVGVVGTPVEPLTYEVTRLYPHEVMPGDIYNFPITGTRFERTSDGEETVTFRYESYADAGLGRDDAYGVDGVEEDSDKPEAKRGKKQAKERETRLGHTWGQPHDLRVQILVHRLGGDFRGRST